MAVVMMLVFMSISMTVLMLVPICVLVFVPISVFMGMGVLFPFGFFCHGMPMFIMIVCMTVFMLVIVCAKFALLGIVLDALVMLVCCMVLLHGCSSSNSAPVLALNVEVGDQRLCLPAEDLL